MTDLMPSPLYYDVMRTDESGGVTTPSKEDMSKLFEGRNLAFILLYPTMDRHMSLLYGQILKMA
jgi:hypothetical protein